jgi:hypothetical protein
MNRNLAASFAISKLVRITCGARQRIDNVKKKNIQNRVLPVSPAELRNSMNSVFVTYDAGLRAEG